MRLQKFGKICNHAFSPAIASLSACKHNGRGTRPATRRRQENGLWVFPMQHQRDETGHQCAQRGDLEEDILGKTGSFLQNITSEHEIILKMNRSVQVRGAFGLLQKRILQAAPGHIPIKFERMAASIFWSVRV